MDNFDAVPLLGRITGILFPPGETSPLNATVCLVHPRIAITLRTEVHGTGSRFTLNVRVGEQVIAREVVLAGEDELFAAFILDEGLPYALPNPILNSPKPINGMVETILASQTPPYVLRPITPWAESIGGKPPRQILRLRGMEGNLYDNPIIGAPIVQEDRLVGVLETWSRSSQAEWAWQVLDTSAILRSSALTYALQQIGVEAGGGSSDKGSPEFAQDDWPGSVFDDSGKKRTKGARKDEAPPVEEPEGSSGGGMLDDEGLVQQQMESMDREFLARQQSNVGGTGEPQPIQRQAEVVQRAEVEQEAEPEAELLSAIAMYDDEAQGALAHAEGMRRAAGLPEVRMEHLIAGLAAFPGDTRKVLHRVAGGADNLRSVLGEHSEAPIPEEYEARVLDIFPPSSATVATARALARLAAESENAEKTTAWHLLVGATTTPGPVIQALLGLGLREAMDDLRRGALVSGLPLAGPPQGEAVGWVRYVADLPTGRPEEEKLGIGREVRALASLLAARETPLPLSLGLFGDWGSGKSFFMSQLETEVAKRSEEGKGDPHSPYCGGIVQLKFNAWHYIDTNLWASLAAAIFQGLAAALDAGEEGDARARAELKGRLLAETTHLQQVRDDARARKRRLDEELREEEARLERLEAEARTVQRSLTSAELARAAWRAVAEHDEVKAAVGSAAERLGIPRAKVDVAEARARLLEMGRIRRSLWAVREALAGESPWRRWAVVAGLALGLAGVLALLDSALGAGILRRIVGAAPVDGIASGIALLAAALGTGAAALKPVLGAVRAAVGVLDRARKESRKHLKRERSEKRRQLLERQSAITGHRADAERQIAATSADLEALERRIAELHPERRLASFVEERAAGTEYTRHLGVIASARRDFEKLDARLDEVLAQARAAAADGARPPAIDRIVLYIDDLDRCPEDKVVDVLQAVHLLLAFDLFVVVVGVDSRWLLHSLRHHSAALRGGDGGAPTDEERVHWESTPLNYLEKIFQIPFTLRPMGREGFGELIDHLAGPEPAAPRTPSPTAGATVADPDAAPPAEPVAPKPDAETVASVPAGPPAGGETRADAPAIAFAEPNAGVETSSPSPAPSPSPATAPVEADAGEDGGGAEPGAEEAATAADADAEKAAKRAWEAGEAAVLAERLAIRKGEREFMKRTHPLIPTPRAAKRFLNVYRLIRGSLDAWRFEALAGDPAEYRAVLLLLALLTGYPAEATALLRDLVESRPEGRWADYLADLERRRRAADAARAAHDPRANGDGGTSSAAKGAKGSDGNGGAPGPADVRHPFDGLEGIEPARWEEMLRRVRAVPLPDGETCGHYVEWARDVGRYSFYSGRVLLGRVGGGEASADEAGGPAPPQSRGAEPVTASAGVGK